MNKWYLKINSSDEFRVRKFFSQYKIEQFSVLKYSDTSEVLFAVYCSVSEQKAILSELKRCEIEYKEVK